MVYPGRQNIYDATIRRMVSESLDRQEQEFLQQHGGDTDEQLLRYLRSCAHRLHHTPWPGEIVGGTVIQERFGTWTRALTLARLPAPRTANQKNSFARVKKEVEKQKEVYRQRKAEKRILATQRRMMQDAKKKNPQ